MNAEKFWASMEKQPDGCWTWKRATGANGYGAVSYKGATHQAHRLAWILTNGPLPRMGGYHGAIVAHKCDVRACCNPDHLFVTDAKGNQIDSLLKGRSNAAKLSVSDVKQIMQALRDGASAREIAGKYSITVPTVRALVNRRTWASVTGDEEMKFAPREFDEEKFRKADYGKIRSMLDSGKTIRQIARECGTTHTTVRRVAAQTHKSVATPFQRLNEVVRERISDLATAGESQASIARWLNVSQASVSRTLAAQRAA